MIGQDGTTRPVVTCCEPLVDNWRPPPPAVSIDSGDLHLWRIRLATTLTDRQGEILTEAELRRAAKLRFVADRRRFIARRAALRQVLSRYLQVPADTIAFDVNAHGKPSIKAPPAHVETLSFNASSCDDLALIVIALNRRIGVDVERINLPPDDVEVARQFLSEKELEEFAGLQGTTRAQRFFAMWTGKEAVLKALGTGLSLSPRLIELAVDDDGCPAISSLEGTLHNTKRWSLHSVSPETGYLGAIAIEGHRLNIHGWTI